MGQAGFDPLANQFVLRGLPARAPYFHNGAAANLSQLVNYNQRFQMGLSSQQMQDLINFLQTL
ncbi:MAG: hypothetical protein ACLP00_10805 [Terracidiphilus sp.]